jgi:nucleoside 2-deoxyribosyltransferase/trans-aconitate methyltransferase
MKRVYWASPLFTEAQRQFNSDWAAALRSVDFEVVLPQELPANDPAHAPTATEIFATDTAHILRCDVLVAVVDDETIDSGVATEIGIAHAAGRAVLGVYTDIRRDRTNGKMYKNLYVLGLLEASLGLVHTREELCDTLSQWREQVAQREHEVQTTGGKLERGALDDMVQRLEHRYQPPWSSYDSVIESLKQLQPCQVVDFGCGTGRLAQRLTDFGVQLNYFGYDADTRQIEVAKDRKLPEHVGFSANFADLIEAVRAKRRNRVVNLSFVLHDMADLMDLRALGCYLESSHVLIHDLCSGDLPAITELLSLAAGKPLDYNLDRRLSISRLQSIAEYLGMHIDQVDPINLKVTFPDREELLTYCDVFGLFAGGDIPIAPHMKSEILRNNFIRVLDGISFPLQDQRLFAKVVARIG